MTLFLDGRSCQHVHGDQRPLGVMVLFQYVC